MKRYALLLLSLVLIVAVLLLLPSKFTVAIGGKGSGKGASITRLDNLVTVVQSFSYMSGEDNSYIAAAAEYGSIHANLRKDISMGYKMRGGGMSSDFACTISSDADMYMTEKGQLYIDAAFDWNTQSNQDNQSSLVMMSIDMKMYTDKECVYVFFSKFDVTQNGVKENVPSQMLGKWIDFSMDGVIDIFQQLISLNTEALALYGEYIDQHLDNGFSKNGDVYTMKSDLFQELAQRELSMAENFFGTGGMDFEFDFDGDFEVDLSNEKKPKIKQNFEYEYPEKVTVAEKSVYIETTTPNFERMEITFLDVNNTIVEFPSDVRVYSMEEIEELVEVAV
ncbi:MAG: hypothetical protein IJ012_01360 [Clostridia bacterium]|nr:hypothetical protein [Clostridia bacterium]